MTGLFIALAVGAALLYAFLEARGIAGESVAEDLRESSAALAELREVRLDRLDFDARQLAGDPYVAALFAEAADSGDSLSIRDLLEERQGDVGYDFATVVTLDGVVAAWTGRPDAAGTDLSRRPLLATALDEGAAAGFWRDQDSLYDAVAVPVGRGFELLGYLVTGYRSAGGVEETAALSSSQLAYAAPAASALELRGTTLGDDVHRALIASLARHQAEVERVLESGDTVEGLELDLAGAPWLAQLDPLRDASGEPVALAVTLDSLDRRMAPFRAISRALLWAGIGSVLLALALSYWFAHRTLQPVRRLVTAATAARSGDYDQEIAVERGDEVGELAGSFNALMSDLREKRDMESYLSELSRSLPEGGLAPTARQVSALRGLDGVLVAIEFRGLARGTSDAAKAARQWDASVRIVEQVVERRGGAIDALAGHRLWARFEGEDRGPRALAAAAEILQGFEEGDLPVLALTRGRCTVGSSSGDGRPRALLVGPAVQQLEGLVREASPGEIIFGRPIFEELSDYLQKAGFSLAERRGVLIPQPLYILSGRLASRLTATVPRVTTTTPTAAMPVRPTLSDIGPGSLVGGRFEILSVLGAGGMGVVYKARDRELEDLVAVKMLRSDRWRDTALVERLKEELKLARKITHPNVLRTFDLGEIDGTPFISMEYVRGVTLRFLLDRTDRLPYSAGLRLARQLCLGLEAAHQVGVVHRDIKPENLILEPNGNAKLMDFGIARPVDRMTPGQTTDGSIVGTPQYLAPEVLEGNEADPRSDLYAVGVVLYEMFTGALPFAGTPLEVIAATVREEPRPPRDLWPEIPPSLADLIQDCLHKQPEERPSSAGALIARLDGLRA
ncbi:MAG: protein kinase [Acidobacteriota bacterium]